MKHAALMREADTTHAAKPGKTASRRRVSRPGDTFECEADRVAHAVSEGKRVPGWSLSMLSHDGVQRQPEESDDSSGQKTAPKPNNYDDALKKVAEAVLKTKTGQEMIEQVTGDPLVKAASDFVKTPAGIAVTGAAATGVIAGLAAAHKPLPVQPPAIPLDLISPKLAGFKLQLSYEGPVNRPTQAMVTLSFGGESSKKKDKQTDSAKYRAETARMATDQEKFRAGMQQGGPAAEEQKRQAQIIQDMQLRRVGTLPAGQSWDPAQMGKNYPQYDLHMRSPEERQDEKAIQRKAIDDTEVEAGDADVDAVLRSGGKPLDQETRRFMESHIGFDFRNVRIHSGARAASSARAINARAYTVGHDIVFSEGRYNPRTAEGRRLLAHELTHVVQQGGAARTTRAIDRSAGAAISRTSGAAGMVQREPEKTEAELNWFEKGMIASAAAPAEMMGSTIHDMVEATLRGFYVEVKTQAPARSAELWGKVKSAFLHPIDQLAPFIGHYWWGLVKGIFSPITGLFDMAKLVVKLNALSDRILSTAWARRAELALMAAGLAKTMEALGRRAGQAIEGLKNDPRGTIKALGPWFSSLEKDAVAKAEQGGHEAGNALMAQVSKPLPELGETAGEIIGALLINIVLLVFTEGIGNAITQVATKLGELGSMLGKLGEGAAMLGKLASGIGDVLGTIGGWITRAETMFAKAAETVLKPIAPLLDELGNMVGGLRSFLRELLGVSEKEASTATEELAGAATRQAEPKTPTVKPKTATPETTAKPAAPKAASTSAAKKDADVIDLAAEREKRAAAALARKKAVAQPQKLAAGAENQTVASYTDEEIGEHIAGETAPRGHGDPLNEGDVDPANIRKSRNVRTTEYDPWKGDSSLLAKRIGPPPGPGYQAHHIVPANEPEAEALREFLKKRGWTDINAGDNGVWLPTGSQTENLGAEFKHEFTFDNDHFDGEYFRRLEDILMKDPKITPSGIALKLRGIRMYLQEGRLPPPGF